MDWQDELRQYIALQLSSGKTRAEIEQMLLQSGWKSEMYGPVLQEMAPGNVAPEASPAPSFPSRTPTNLSPAPSASSRMNPTIPTRSMSNLPSSFNTAGGAPTDSPHKPGIPKMYMLAGVVLLIAIILAAVLLTQGGGAAQKTAANLNGLSLKQLQALNQSIECDVNNTNVKSAKLYVKGDKVRMDAQIETNGKTSGTSLMVSGSFAYINLDSVKESFGASGQSLTCNWLKFDTQDPAQSCGLNSSVLEKQVPASSLACKPASFGDDEFSPSGKVCDFADKTNMDVVVMMGFFPGCTAAAPQADRAGAGAKTEPAGGDISVTSGPFAQLVFENIRVDKRGGFLKGTLKNNGARAGLSLIMCTRGSAEYTDEQIRQFVQSKLPYDEVAWGMSIEAGQSVELGASETRSLYGMCYYDLELQRTAIQRGDSLFSGTIYLIDSDSSHNPTGVYRIKFMDVPIE